MSMTGWQESPLLRMDPTVHRQPVQKDASGKLEPEEWMRLVGEVPWHTNYEPGEPGPGRRVKGLPFYA